MWINNASPTIYFKDTDHRGAMLHNNSNLFYVLRGCEATASTTWCTVGGVWPFVINLETNAITTGGSITATSDIRLKTNIKPLPENILDKVEQLRGVYFNWKTEADMGNARQIDIKLLVTIALALSSSKQSKSNKLKSILLNRR